MRILLSLLTYLVALAFVAIVSFLVVIVLAGPHAGLVPHWLEGAILAFGWVAVLVLPVLASRWAWRRLGRPLPPPGPEPEA